MYGCNYGSLFFFLYNRSTITVVYCTFSLFYFIFRSMYDKSTLVAEGSLKALRHSQALYLSYSQKWVAYIRQFCDCVIPITTETLQNMKVILLPSRLRMQRWCWVSFWRKLPVLCGTELLTGSCQMDNIAVTNVQRPMLKAVGTGDFYQVTWLQFNTLDYFPPGRKGRFWKQIWVFGLQ